MACPPLFIFEMVGWMPIPLETIRAIIRYPEVREQYEEFCRQRDRRRRMRIVENMRQRVNLSRNVDVNVENRPHKRKRNENEAHPAGSMGQWWAVVKGSANKKST